MITMEGNYLSPIIDAFKPILIFAAVLWGIEIIITMLIKDHKKANIKRFPIASVISVSSATRWHVRRLSMRTGSPSCSATFCMVRMGVHGLFSDRVANVGYLSAG